MVATEDVVFGYRSPSSSIHMNDSDESEDDDLLTDDVPGEEPIYSEARTMKITVGELRKVIQEEASNAFAQGLKPLTVEVLQKKWPKFYSYLVAKFSDELPQAKVALKKTGVFGGDPWVLLPKSRQVLFWNSKQETFVYSSSETAASALANL